jgi:hypothetical protein
MEFNPPVAEDQKKKVHHKGTKDTNRSENWHSKAAKDLGAKRWHNLA